MQDKNNTKSKLLFAFSMIIFGTVGIFRKYIPFSSGFVAMARGFIGAFVLLLFLLLSRRKIRASEIKKYFLPIALSGAFMGLNWVLLFEAYNYTTVATATLCYYMAPVFLTLLSPIFLKERLTPCKLICVGVSLVGMVLVSGVFDASADGGFVGILLGLSAALLYTLVILLNKRMPEAPVYERTALQLLFAAIAVLPYTLFAEEAVAPTGLGVLLLVAVGVLHTGICYVFYFGSMRKIDAAGVALFSYIDPAVAVVLSALLLSEPFTYLTAVGAALILGSSLFAELYAARKNK